MIQPTCDALAIYLSPSLVQGHPFPFSLRKLACTLLCLIPPPSLSVCVAIITLPKAAVEGAPAVHWCRGSHPCLIHDLQGDFIRQRLHSLPFTVWYSVRVPENCKCFTPSTFSTLAPPLDGPWLCQALCVSDRPTPPPLSLSQYFVSSKTKQWHFSPRIWKFHICQAAPTRSDGAVLGEHPNPVGVLLPG